MNKEYIREGGYYFSGQGYVSLETEDKIFELGNCTDLVFYNDGKFSLVWEKFYGQNIELLLGESCGEETFIPAGWTKESKFSKFKLNKNFGKDFTLNFSGINTADSNRPIIVRASVRIGMPEFIPLINDELAAFLTNGEWMNDLEIFLPYHEKQTTSTESTAKPQTIEYVAPDPPKYKLSSSAGNIVKVLAYTGRYNYQVIGGFNPEHVVTMKKYVSSSGIMGTKLILSNDTMLIDLPIQEVANFLDRLNCRDSSKRNHTEKMSGRRLVDYTYNAHESNKIKFGV